MVQAWPWDDGKDGWSKSFELVHDQESHPKGLLVTADYYYPDWGEPIDFFAIRGWKIAGMAGDQTLNLWSFFSVGHQRPLSHRKMENFQRARSMKTNANGLTLGSVLYSTLFGWKVFEIVFIGFHDVVVKNLIGIVRFLWKVLWIFSW